MRKITSLKELPDLFEGEFPPGSFVIINGTKGPTLGKAGIVLGRNKWNGVMVGILLDGDKGKVVNCRPESLGPLTLETWHKFNPRKRGS